MIHLVTWLPLPYQRTLCRTLGEAYGPAFVAWFAERTHREFPYRSDAQERFVHHYLSEVGYGKFLRALRSDSEAVVVLCGWSSPMTKKTLLTTMLLRIPVFIWADHPHPRQRRWVAELSRNIYLRLLGRMVSGFLACGSPTVEHLVLLGLDRKRTTNFPYWVEVPEEWSLPKGCLDDVAINRPLRLVAVGRHVAVKRFDMAIESVALANKSAGPKSVELVMVGDGPERSRLEALAQSLDDKCISFRGWLEIDRVYDELLLADALIMTSTFEGYGVVALEAMAAGRPVLASAGVVSAVDRDEGTGAVMIHPIGDRDFLAKQITVLANDRDQLRNASIAARATAEKWAPERAVTILDALLIRTERGRMLLRQKNEAARARAMDNVEPNHRILNHGTVVSSSEIR